MLHPQWYPRSILPYGRHPCGLHPDDPSSFPSQDSNSNWITGTIPTFPLPTLPLVLSLPPPGCPITSEHHHHGGIPPGCSLCPKWGFGPVLPSGPPKRDPPKEPLREAAGCRDAPCVRNAAPIGQQQPPLVGVTGFKALQRLARRRSKDVEFQEGWFGSKGKGWAPLRHRSSSEVTLSECDPEEATEPRGAKLGAGGGIFREYGSTSSIDIQGISEQSFFEMLNEFRTKKPERRAASPERLGEAAFPMGSSTGIKADNRNGAREEALPQCKEKPRRRCPKGDASTESIFRKLRSTRNDAEPEEPRMPEPGRSWWCQKSFAHYDVQSILFDLNAVATNRVLVAQRRNTTTGASAASSGMGSDPAFPGAEDPNSKENLEHDLGDNTSNELLLSCPHFRNEIGGAGERNVSFSKASGASPVIPVSDGSFPEPVLDLRPTNAAISVLEVPKELQRNPNRLKHYSVEHVDLGARYYRDHFHGKEHSNYFGVDEKLGPVAVSIKREKLEDHKDHGPQYQYRLIFRTTHHPPWLHPGRCHRLCRRHKVGILYCKAGQSSEEEMYNNEEAGSAFEEFLMLLGEKVCLKAFSKYAAQLDTKTDSTGTHSLYTTYQDYEIMFHVSTMLPYTPNNRQQLLRKRHIGNDIVTIIFQEPGALPFTPQNIRSHFQHVFIIVRAHNPCTENVSYSVAVTRSKDVPSFGPPIPNGVTFRKSDVFREFLLAKVINAENAAHKSDKFHTMATRTRREYLKDLAENWVTNTPIDSSGKFNLISLASKKKEKTKARIGAEQHSAGAISWRVSALDFARGAEISCALGISNEFVVLLDLGAKEVVFNCFCGDVIGWTAEAATIKIFYGRGDHIFIRAGEGGAEDIKEIVQRLKVDGCDTVDMTLRRNGLGQLGFHVKYDGTVAEVEDYGFAWQAGLRQGSRLVEICKVAVVTLSHEQMIDLLRTSVTVKVVIVPPHEDGAPRSTFTRYKPSPERWVPPWGPPLYPIGMGGTMGGVWHRFGLISPHSHCRFMAASEPPDGDSSSGGVSSHESTMERHNPGMVTPPLPPPMATVGPMVTPTQWGPIAEPLWHVPAQPRLPTGRRSSKQEPAGMDSPKRHSKVIPVHPKRGGAPYSSHSSTTTLSSTASSDERWFDIPDPNDGTEFPDPFPKGSSNDSGIDTPKPPRPLSQRDKGPKAIVAPGDDATTTKGDPSPPSTSYRHKAGTPPTTQVEATPKNVFGQPRLRASLRDLRSPRRTYKSTIEDDLKKLIIMDSTSPEPERAPVLTPIFPPQTPPKGLQRTLSDESLCGGRRDPSYPSGSPVLDAEGSFGSTYPSSTLPNRRQHPATTNGGLHDKKGPISASELSLRRVDPGMMPLPDTATGLEWASLVNAAKAYEAPICGAETSICGSATPIYGAGTPPPITLYPSHSPPTPLDLPEKVSQLEAMLKQLHSDLQKEKQDKVVLQAEVANLRHNNRRLQQESHSAASCDPLGTMAFHREQWCSIGNCGIP
uniref:Uncharacterized protein n=1 Tax=Melopsittacus undulatus TaxID=13146 RepID=A0A8C6J3J6_MELUD